MTDYVIEAQARTIVGKKVSQLRRQGLVPGTIYGPKTEAVSIQIPYRPLQVALMQAGGTNLIDIKVEKATHTVLAREVQRDVLRGDIMHVDFFAVDLKAKVTTSVPVVFVGESPAVEARLGTLITGISMLTIESLPQHLMHEIEIDLSSLKELGDSILVGDLDLGPDVTVLTDPEETLARITQSASALAEGEAEEGEEFSAEVEVIHRGKDEEDEE